MSSEAAQPVRPDAVQGLKQRILHGYCVRVHMSLIVTAVVVSGVLSSKLLLESGIHSLRLRYAIAVAASYGVFLLLVRVWIWYVEARRGVWSRSSGGNPNLDFGTLDFGIPSPRGLGGSGVRFGGGSSGGGGASDVWDEGGAPLRVAGQASSGHGSFLPDLDLGGGDDDGVLVMVLLVALVLGIFCAGGYLVYAAPQILPDAACQVILAPALLRVSKDYHHGWMGGVLRSTVLPFAIVCLLAGGLGWAAHRHCPAAVRLIEVWNCPGPI